MGKRWQKKGQSDLSNWVVKDPAAVETPLRPSQQVHDRTPRPTEGGQHVIVPMERLSTGGTLHQIEFKRGSSGPMTDAERARKKRLRKLLWPEEAAASNTKDAERMRLARSAQVSGSGDGSTATSATAAAAAIAAAAKETGQQAQTADATEQLRAQLSRAMQVMVSGVAHALLMEVAEDVLKGPGMPEEQEWEEEEEEELELEELESEELELEEWDEGEGQEGAEVRAQIKAVWNQAYRRDKKEHRRTWQERYIKEMERMGERNGFKTEDSDEAHVKRLHEIATSLCMDSTYWSTRNERQPAQCSFRALFTALMQRGEGSANYFCSKVCEFDRIVQEFEYLDLLTVQTSWLQTYLDPDSFMVVEGEVHLM